MPALRLDYRRKPHPDGLNELTLLRQWRYLLPYTLHSRPTVVLHFHKERVLIRSLSILYRSEHDLARLPQDILSHPADRMLIQVFSGILEEDRIKELLDQLKSRFPGAPILGTTTAGEILDGKSLDNSTVLGITCFENSRVRSSLVAQNDDLPAAGRALGISLGQPDTKVVIAFGCGIKDKRTLFAQSLLDALRQQLPGAALAGGQAGDNGRGTHTLVFTDEGIAGEGVAAVSIAGADLIANNAYTLSWVPIGKKMTITHAQGSRVYAIDGQTPYDIYSHYLGKEVADGLPLSAAEFSLMIERDGVLLAIHATGVNPDGSIDYIHNFNVGEQLRFGHCHTGLIGRGAQRLCAELSAQPAETAFVYSCVSRKWILGADVLVELALIDCVAPSTGFFSYGEFFGRPHCKPVFLSQTLTVLCLAEGNAKTRREGILDTRSEPEKAASRQFKTMRVLHRLVETSTREIETTNRELAGLAQKDFLTGLANRRLFEERLALEIKLFARSGNQLSLIMLDVDHFKCYNDTYGHVMGDNCLRGVGQVLREVVQRSSDLVARYGGEEFAVILPDIAHARAMLLADTVRQGIERLSIQHSASATSHRVTASLGVVTVSLDKTSDSADIVSLADEQLYLAKESGRNQVRGLDRTISAK